jgi:hypothetical protein
MVPDIASSMSASLGCELLANNASHHEGERPLGLRCRRCCSSDGRLSLTDELSLRDPVVMHELFHDRLGEQLSSPASRGA